MNESEVMVEVTFKGEELSLEKFGESFFYV